MTERPEPDATQERMDKAPWDGVPPEWERDHWCWLMRGGVARPFRWRPSDRDEPCGWFSGWFNGGVREMSPEVAADPRVGWRYLGPCLTPAEVAAKVEAEREAIIRMAKKAADIPLSGRDMAEGLAEAIAARRSNDARKGEPA